MEDGDYNYLNRIMSLKNTLINNLDLNKTNRFTNDDERFRSWIPTNSGYIRPNLIGLPQNKKNRFRINHDNDHDNLNITVINYNLDLKDDLPNYFEVAKSFFKRLYGKVICNKKTIKTIKEYGYFKNDDEQIFINNLQLVEDLNDANSKLLSNENLIKKINNNEDITNIGYIGKAYLCHLTPQDFKQLINSYEIGQFRLLNSEIELEQKKIDSNFNKFSGYFSKENSNFTYTFSISYKIELRGIITLYDLDLIINENKQIDVEHILNESDGKIEVIQQLFTLIKINIHGDSHHHYKSDTILKIIPENEFNIESTILNQITHFVKILDKVEQKRKTLPCNKLIPSFRFDAEGVNCYANAYRKLYMSKSSPDLYLSFEDDILKSIKAINDRNEESSNLVNKMISRHFDFLKSLVPFAILSVGFIALLFNKEFIELSSNLENIGLFRNLILIFVNLILEYKVILFLLLILVILFPYVKKNYCFKKYLFKDARPRDTTTARLLYLYHNNEISFLRKYFKSLVGLTVLIFCFFHFNLSTKIVNLLNTVNITNIKNDKLDVLIDLDKKNLEILNEINVNFIKSLQIKNNDGLANLEFISSIDILFEKGKIVIDEQYIKKLDELIKNIDKTKFYTMKIDGYSSFEKLKSNNTFSDNFQLSEARAINLKNILIEKLKKNNFNINNINFIINYNSNSNFDKNDNNYNLQRLARLNIYVEVK